MDIPECRYETFGRRIYLHLFYKLMNCVDEDASFDLDFLELKAQLDDGTAVELF